MVSGVQAIRQFLLRRDFIGYTCVTNLCFRPHNALSNSGRFREEGSRNFLGGEAADFAQRHGDLSFRCERRMAASKDQPEPVVLDAFIVLLVDIERGRRLRLFRHFSHRRIMSGAPTHAVDGLEAAGRDEPRPRIGRHTIPCPLFHSDGKRIV